MNHKIFITTTGCVSLRLDTLRMLTYLRTNGYQLVSRYDDANIILFSACIVTEEKEIHGLDMINEFMRSGKRVVIVGCASNALPDHYSKCIVISNDEEFEAFFPPTTIHLSDIDHGGESVDFGYTPMYLAEYLEHYHLFENVLRRFGNWLADQFKYGTMGFEFVDESDPHYRVVVSQGCNFRCSYCIVWKGRGAYRSQSIDQIISQVQRGYAKNYRKFLFVTDELSSYGHDLYGRLMLPDLLQSIISKFPDVLISLRYLEPIRLHAMWDSLKEHVKDSSIMYLNIPIQSGSQRILNKMNRPTDLTSLKGILSQLRLNYSGPLLTHVIVGAPYEETDDIQLTASFLRDNVIDDVSIHKHSARPGSGDESLEPHPKMRYHFEIMETTRKFLRARYLKRILSAVVDSRSPATHREREYRYPTQLIPSRYRDYLYGLDWIYTGRQIDIVLMNRELPGFVARIRMDNGLFLQFKIKEEHRTWNEISMEITCNEIEGILATLREFLDPVVVVSKERSVIHLENNINLYLDRVDGIGEYIEIEGIDGVVDSYLIEHGLEPVDSSEPYGKIIVAINSDQNEHVEAAIELMKSAPSDPYAKPH